jgi:uncharacterized protein (TIGR03000 family)
LPNPKDKKELEAGQVKLRAPADAKLTVDGQPLKMNGTAQTFDTPALEPGRSYSYTFSAEVVRDGKTVTREKKVTVYAGASIEVDFTDLAVRVAKVTIIMPAEARLIVDGVAYPEGAAKRTLETPDLEAGRKYTYTMRAEMVRDGNKLKEERRVEVEAGKDVTVEFTKLTAVQAAQR